MHVGVGWSEKWCGKMVLKKPIEGCCVWWNRIEGFQYDDVIIIVFFGLVQVRVRILAASAVAQ